jgi:RHS repeat-associated protein
VFQNTRLTYTATVVLGDEPGQAQYAYTAEGIYDYDPYGKILRSYTKSTEKYLTTAHERDTETDLDYRGARFYDSEVVRFLSLDPLAAKYANLSPYNYVAGNPVMLIDPTGKSPEDAEDVLVQNQDGEMVYRSEGTVRVTSDMRNAAVEKSTWQRTIAKNHNTFYKALQEGLATNSERGYNIRADNNKIDKEGIKEGDGKVDYDATIFGLLAGLFHSHPTGNNPYSTGDFGNLFKQVATDNIGTGYYDILYTKEKIYVVVIENAKKAKQFYKEKASIQGTSNGEPYTTYDMAGTLSTNAYDNYNNQTQSLTDRYEAMYRDFFNKDSGIKIYTAPTKVTAPANFTLLNNK